MGFETEEPAETWFREVLKYAAVAGGCRALGRLEPSAARGMNKVADKYREQARTLLTARLTPTPAVGALGQERRNRRIEGRGV